ncbi:MAG: PDZ domain-containing protein [Gemmatimonadota bacterium]
MWRGEIRVAAGVVVASLSWIGSIAQAQEPRPDARVPIPAPAGTYQVLPDQPRARLGVFLDAECAAPDAEGVCDRPPIVLSVVENGPADRAGVRQRDTILALNGSPLSSPEGRRALQSLESGREVLLTLSGPEGRREIAVTPELRAPARVMQFEWRSSPEADHEGEEIRMYRFPAVESIGELELRLDSMIAEDGERAFVMIGPDSEGELRVEIVGSEPEILRSRVTAGTQDTVATGYVVESRELAQRLEAVRNRTLRTARVRFDSLVHSQAGGIEFMVAPNRRVAGAEFLPLTPELAENFAGVEEGLLVLRVIPNTPAGILGLRGGDVVVEADGDPARSIDLFRARILNAGPEGVVVKWIRKGAESEGRMSLH